MTSLASVTGSSANAARACSCRNANLGVLEFGDFFLRKPSNKTGNRPCCHKHVGIGVKLRQRE